MLPLPSLAVTVATCGSSTVQIKLPLATPGSNERFAVALIDSVMFVPVNAIYRQQGTGDSYVFIVNGDNTVTRTKVTRGESIDTYVHIPEIDENTIVVVDGKNKLDDGATVEIVK